jgi:hypothetical protein
MSADRPIIFDENGNCKQLPLTSPLIVGEPTEDDHAVTLEVLEQLIKERQEANNE